MGKIVIASMFPAQTSFIPITVALSKYISVNGFGGNYPYWYLGSTPAKYLIGPILPMILISLNKLGVAFFDGAIFLTCFSLLLEAAGWGLFAKKMSGKLSALYIVAILILLAPVHWILGFGLGETSAILAQGLTPWFLVVLVYFQKIDPKKLMFGLGLFFALLLLVNSTAVIPVIVGLFILNIVFEKKWEEGVRKAILVIVIGWLISTLWYGFGYWLTIWSAPSVGGRSLIGALGTLVDLFRLYIPIILAVVIVAWRVKPKTNFEKFVLYWLVVFGVMTFFRYISDYKFWIDWITWFGEIEVGLILLLVLVLHKGISWHLLSFKNLKLLIVVFVVLAFIFGWTVAFKNLGFWFVRGDISNTVEFKIAKKLESVVGRNEAVLLSGSTAFWLNSLVDVRQIRGGRDEVSADPIWRGLVWKIRQGEDVENSISTLRQNEVKYLVVHTQESSEFYHDFVRPEIFKLSSNLKPIYSLDGDIIYKID